MTFDKGLCVVQNARRGREPAWTLIKDFEERNSWIDTTMLSSDDATVMDKHSTTWARELPFQMMPRNYKELYHTVTTIQNIERFSLDRFQGSDDDIRFWTGFYSYTAFMLFWKHYVERNTTAMRYWGADKCGPKRKLAPIDELFMVLEN